MWVISIFYSLIFFFIGNKLFIKDDQIIGNNGNDMHKNISILEPNSDLLLSKIRGHIQHLKIMEILENKNISDVEKLQIIKETPLLENLDNEDNNIRPSEWYLGLDW
jgi:hypothetical protein